MRHLVKRFSNLWSVHSSPSQTKPDSDKIPDASPPKRRPKDALRKKFLESYALENGRGLEIGPFCRPVFRRESYPNMLYADVKSEDFLKRLVRKGDTYKEEDLVPLDYVLGNQHLDAVVAHETLDFVFCAHVLEHVPDMISSLKGIERVLKPGGLFLCFYPDRRFTYDIDRPTTTLSQLETRHKLRITRPASDTVLEHFTFNRKVDAGKVWANHNDAVGERRFTAEQAQEFALQATRSYVDVHCNVFSDSEFSDMIETLGAAGHISLRVDRMVPTRAPFNEFHVALRKP